MAAPEFGISARPHLAGGRDEPYYRVPAISLGAALRDPRPSRVFAVWFGINLLVRLAGLTHHGESTSPGRRMSAGYAGLLLWDFRSVRGEESTRANLRLRRGAALLKLPGGNAGQREHCSIAGVPWSAGLASDPEGGKTILSNHRVGKGGNVVTIEPRHSPTRHQNLTERVWGKWCTGADGSILGITSGAYRAAMPIAAMPRSSYT